MRLASFCLQLCTLSGLPGLDFFFLSCAPADAPKDEKVSKLQKIRKGTLLKGRLAKSIGLSEQHLSSDILHCSC